MIIANTDKKIDNTFFYVFLLKQALLNFAIYSKFIRNMQLILRPCTFNRQTTLRTFVISEGRIYGNGFVLMFKNIFFNCGLSLNAVKCRHSVECTYYEP